MPTVGQEVPPTPGRVITKQADNWVHRHHSMRCRTCMWFVEKETDMPQMADHVIGRCRKHSPTMAGFPVVFSDDWCGDHKLNEQKV